MEGIGSLIIPGVATLHDLGRFRISSFSDLGSHVGTLVEYRMSGLGHCDNQPFAQSPF